MGGALNWSDMAKVRIFLANVGLRRPLYPLVTPPMGLMCLAAYLRKCCGAEVRIVNQKLHNVSNEALVQEAVRFGADIVGLAALTPSAYRLRAVSELLRRALPKAPVIIGGPHVSAFEGAALESVCADAAVVGEGELAFERIVQVWREGGSLSEVPGLYWREREEGAPVTKNPGALPCIQDLDSLPFAAYDLIDLPSYWKRQSMPPIPRRRYVSLFSSRGCPFQCSWCHHIFGKRFRMHSAERILDEAAHLTKTYGVDDVEFLDDIFNYDHERTTEFCDLVTKRNLKIRIAFPNAIRADIVTEEEMEGLVAAGMYFCSFALESGSPRIQQVTGKHLNIPRFLKTVERAVDHGVFSNGFAMLGFPTETKEDMQMTLDVACNSPLHTASFFTVTPFPNTELYNTAMTNCPEQLAQIDYEDMDFNSMSVNLSAVSDEVLYRYQREANRRFFMNPRRIFRIARDFPQPHLLPLYLPHFVQRATKGILAAARLGGFAPVLVDGGRAGAADDQAAKGTKETAG